MPDRPGPQVQARLLAPIAPHWAEHIWGGVLGRDSLVVTAGWPQASPVDASLQHARHPLPLSGPGARARAAQRLCSLQALPYASLDSAGPEVSSIASQRDALTQC